jgi:2-polyprenyl-6-hydroxyphenyl methylase/3-demethylubiquinone-9 3-methyltransferase
MSTQTRSLAPGGGAASIIPAEVARFDALAREWWDPNGPMRPLHRINPLRLGFVRDEACRHFGRDPRAPFALEGLSALDVGCGAGLLSEPLARLGAEVTGLDPAPANIEAARRHAEGTGLDILYRTDLVETVAASGERYDLVLAMEVVEHVPDVHAFVEACAACAKPGGLVLLSTINRTLRSFALAIVGAEYVLRWLPRGTHEWEKFVTPAELRLACAAAGLTGFQTRGMVFNPLADSWRLSSDTAVNYLAAAARPPGP